MKKKNLNISERLSLDNGRKYRVNEASVQLIKLVLNMTENEREQLLTNIERGFQSRYRENRKHPRKQVFIYVKSYSHEYVFADFIQNISRGGVYIETEPKTSLSVGEKLTNVFALSDTGGLAKIRGRIVRIDSKGIGVHFDKPLSKI